VILLFTPGSMLPAPCFDLSASARRTYSKPNLPLWNRDMLGRMNASGTARGKVKHQEKIGGLHKHVGCYGFNGLAKMCRAGHQPSALGCRPNCIADS
jgi:hypothetical protein